jgi:hypothetical protein
LVVIDQDDPTGRWLVSKRRRLLQQEAAIIMMILPLPQL